MRGLCVALFAMLFLASLDASPQNGDWSVWEFPNGLHLYVRPMKSDRTALMFRYRAGWRYDPPGKAGLAHLTEHLTFCRPAADGMSMDDRVYVAGGSWGGATSREYVSFYWDLPADEANLALDYERVRLLRDDFDEASLERERKVVLSELEGLGNEHGAFGVSFAADCSDSASLAAITLEDVRGFHRRRYVPAALEIFACGALEPGAFLAEVEKRFADMEGPALGTLPGSDAISDHPCLETGEGWGVFRLPPPACAKEEAAMRVVMRAFFGLSASPPLQDFTVESEKAAFSLLFPRCGSGGAVFFRCTGDPAALWAEVRREIKRLLASDRERVRRLLDAAWNCELAAWLERMETPSGVLEDIAARGLFERHITFENDLYSLSPAAIGGILRLLISETPVRESALPAVLPVEAHRGGNRDGKAAEADGAGSTVATLRGKRISRLRLFFPGALRLDPAAARALARTLFHSRGGEGETNAFKLERMGWRWSIDGAVWKFAGLTENLRGAVAVVSDVLRNPRFNRAEYDFQVRRDESASDPLEAMECALMAEVRGKPLPYGRARAEALKSFTAGRCRVRLETGVPRSVASALLERCFGTPPPQPREKERPPLTEPAYGVSLSQAFENGRRTFGVLIRGPSFDSADLSPFLAVCCLLGAGGRGAAGPVARFFRDEGLYDFSIKLAADLQRPYLLITAFGRGGAVERAQTALSLYLARLASAGGVELERALRALRNRLVPAHRTVFLGSPVFPCVMEYLSGADFPLCLSKSIGGCNVETVRRVIEERLVPLGRRRGKKLPVAREE